MNTTLRNHIITVAEETFGLQQGDIANRANRGRSSTQLGEARAAVVGVIRDLYGSDKPTFSSIAPLVKLTVAGTQDCYNRFGRLMNSNKRFTGAITKIVRSAVQFDKERGGDESIGGDFR